MRLAYCTGMRRWACSTNTIAAMMSNADREDEGQGDDARATV